jgi:hypothetical protein
VVKVSAEKEQIQPIKGQFLCTKINSCLLQVDMVLAMANKLPCRFVQGILLSLEATE